MVDDFIEAEVIYPDEMHGNEVFLNVDHLKHCYWKTSDGRVVAVPDMSDSHLRNAALFLMGMGFRKSSANPDKAVIYLTIFRMEWERRMLQRAGGNKRFHVDMIDDGVGESQR